MFIKYSQFLPEKIQTFEKKKKKLKVCITHVYIDMCIIIYILYINIYGNQEIKFVRQKCLTLSIINKYFKTILC